MKNYLICLLLFVSTYSYGQIFTQSEQLSDLFIRTKSELLNNEGNKPEKIFTDSLLNEEYNLSDIPGEDLKLKTVFRNNTILTHIGLNLFTPEQNIKLPIISRFVERYLLEKLIPVKAKQGKANKNINIAFKGKLVKNGLSKEIKAFLNNNYSYELNAMDEELNITLLDSLESKLIIYFPRNISQISGMDKKELDDFYENIFRAVSISGKEKILNYGDNSSEYLTAEESFTSGSEEKMEIYPGISNRKTFTKNGPVFNVEEIDNSLKNLFLGVVKKDFLISVKHYKYGNKNEKYDLNYYSILKYLTNHNYKVYNAVFNFEEKFPQTIILFYNKLMSNFHMMVVNCPLNVVFGSDRINLDAELYTNIRSDNVNDIFKNYDDKNQRIQIKPWN